MIRLVIDVGPAAEQIADRLAAIEDAIAVRDLLDEGGALLLNRQRTRFLDQVNPDGVAWLPSKAALRRQATGEGGGTLFRTGRLFHGIQLHTDGPNDRSISDDVPYGVFHQYGKGDMLRQFLGFSEDDNTLFLSLVMKRIDQIVKESR